MKLLCVDAGVALIGFRIVKRPFCFELFFGKKGVCFGTDELSRERAIVASPIEKSEAATPAEIALLAQAADKTPHEVECILFAFGNLRSQSRPTPKLEKGPAIAFTAGGEECAWLVKGNPNYTIRNYPPTK
jgi:hypothetical protein